MEKWIKYYRKHFARMPGVCFYPAVFENAGARELWRHCDRLVQKYYVDPAPKITIATPTDGRSVGVDEVVRVATSADKPVAKWRLYVGAKQVEENKTGKFVVKHLPAGRHVLTVHAITADWLRAAKQLELSVAPPKTKN